ncbi:CU044_5270 family protein [Streptomyces sp. NPDC059352]|uniref:CU044_5270 family protein n=1 Tax=Streptomyces sp. NPDC059352 TaxID=3346810 RepID=UPI0036C37216
MSTTPSRPTPPEPTPPALTPAELTPAERDEIARLLQVPSDRDLPVHRHEILKAHLLREIRHDTTSAAEPRRGVRRLTLAAVPLAAGALAVTLLATGGLLDGQQPPVDRRAAAAPGPGVGSGSGGKGTAASPAAVLLDRIATVAASRPAPTVRDDQYVYIASTVAYSSQSDSDIVMRLAKPHSRRIWLSVDGSRPGLLREYDKNIELADHHPEGIGAPVPDRPAGNPDPTLNSPTYRLLEALPTDPDVLLKKIYDDTEGSGPNPDQEAFVTIGDLLREQLAPPKVSAALYKAAAGIPGVTVVDDAVDAAGRHGIAVARVHDDGIRTEWIFDRKTLEFLGERGVMVKDTPWAKAGQVTATTAVLTRGITDKPGETPGHNG